MSLADKTQSSTESQALHLEPTSGKGSNPIAACHLTIQDLIKYPYAVDACRLIPQELIMLKPKDEFSVVEQELELKKWRHQAALLVLSLPAVEEADPARWDLSNLQQLRLYIARTPPEKRCLCTNRPLESLDDHWPECPSALEARLKRFEERQRKCHQMKIRHLTKNLCRLVNLEGNDFIPDEEVRSLYSVFEKEMKKRAL